MSRTLKEVPITTAKARSRLPAGEYARRLDADAALWRQAPLGPANDVNDKSTEGLFTFLQAEARARQIVAQARDEVKAAEQGPPLTVQLAIESYISERDARETRRAGRTVRSDAGQRLSRYVIGQERRGNRKAIAAADLAGRALHGLKESDLLEWREKLPATMKATSKQRLVKDLKAALNNAYAANRDRLSPTLPAIIKHGLKAPKLDDDEAVPLARENQILTEAQIASLRDRQR